MTGSDLLHLALMAVCCLAILGLALIAGRLLMPPRHADSWCAPIPDHCPHGVTGNHRLTDAIWAVECLSCGDWAIFQPENLRDLTDTRQHLTTTERTSS